jgi:hypothetical protein
MLDGKPNCFVPQQMLQGQAAGVTGCSVIGPELLLLLKLGVMLLFSWCRPLYVIVPLNDGLLKMVRRQS